MLVSGNFLSLSAVAALSTVPHGTYLVDTTESCILGPVVKITDKGGNKLISYDAGDEILTIDALDGLRLYRDENLTLDTVKNLNLDCY